MALLEARRSKHTVQGPPGVHPILNRECVPFFRPPQSLLDSMVEPKRSETSYQGHRSPLEHRIEDHASARSSDLFQNLQKALGFADVLSDHPQRDQIKLFPGSVTENGLLYPLVDIRIIRQCLV